MGKSMNYCNPKKKRLLLPVIILSIRCKKFKKWLQSQNVFYTHYKSVRRQFPRRKTIVSGAKFQFQADLIDFSVMKKCKKIANTFLLWLMFLQKWLTLHVSSPKRAMP